MTISDQGAAPAPNASFDAVFRFASYMLVALFLLGAFTMPVAAFSVDEAIYIEMARAMADNASFAIASDGGVDGSPTLLQRWTYDDSGQAYPQYPGGYGVIAAPFFALLNVRGLILLNTLSALIVIFATHRLAIRLYDDRDIASISVLLLTGATFLSTYAFGIWPHMLALALIMIGAERIARKPEQLANHTDLLLGGFAFGFAICLRTDAILFILAAFLWLRLFAAPAKRSTALIFVVGLFPGLLAASLINDVKFGVFSPISYGPPDEEGLSGKYFPYVGAVAALLIAATIVDISSKPATRIWKPLLQQRLALPLAALAFTVALLSEELRTWLWNAYVLVVDLERLDDEQLIQGMFRMENGFIYHWGAFKPALLQSMPFAVLCVIPLAGLLKSERSKEHCLSFAMISAPIAFYALTQWHGGYALSMRYFLPCLPFLAILSAHALKEQLGVNTRVDVQMGAVVGALIAGVGLTTLGNELSTARLVFENYTPLVIAALLMIVGALIASRWSTDAMRRAFFSVAGAAIAWSVVSSMTDLATFHTKMSGQEKISRALSAAVPKGSLVFTTMEEWMMDASRKGVHIYNPKTGDTEDEAAAAFLAAGRCVYVHQTRALELFDPPVSVSLTAFEAPNVPDFAARMYGFTSQSANCSLARTSGEPVDRN